MHAKNNASASRTDSTDSAESAGQDRAEVARLKRSRERQKIRGELRSQVQRAAHAITRGAGLFMDMTRADEAALLQRELHPDQAEQLKEKILDKVFEKVRESLERMADVGEAVAGGAVKVFGVVKSAVDKHIALGKKISVLQITKGVYAAIEEKALEVEHALLAAVDKIPAEKLLAAGKIMDQAEQAGRLSADQDDSPERGDIGEGMRQDMMVRMGLPAGDLVAAEDVALAAYGAFKEQVRASGTAAEAVDSAQRDMAHPGEDREKLDAVEEGMGEGFQKQLGADKTLRARVAAVRS